ncbi:MAG: UDP-N-acetylmuramoyl-tripeptide--D-alanyl-D-alanine ligase [Bacilli bacterium]|nr:UDP-N-acetylmuramoyl-tripeptide--D-alanyl-D-alanine ligase [Bacilli bacterium]MDD4808535.1 UDP-N-acetylmuramoyl-tripeptide--D-alanyl-D-alanine ligase [Bacilli bacterium]
MIELIFALYWWSGYLILRTKKSLQMLQQNTYDKGYRYLKWIIKNRHKVFDMIDLIPLCLILVISFINNNLIIIILTSIVYLYLYYRTYDKLKLDQDKLPLVMTSRLKRIILMIILLYLGIFTLILKTHELSILKSYLYLFIILAYLGYFMTFIANRLCLPIEKLVSLYYLTKAKLKIKKIPELKVIGITGSYGKTSCKNILNDILNTKYSICTSPKNYNTPYGLSITINNYLNKFHQLLIAEMGARKVGEIKELSRLVSPKYGILTSIGIAHLDSFGSIENIQKCKFELIESLPHDGVAILNKDDSYQTSYYLKNKCKVIWIGIDNKGDVTASDIKLSALGTSFMVTFKGEEKKYLFETVLLGKVNVYNILVGIALAHELGMKIEDIQKGVKKIKPIEHRLELKKYGSIMIIDDAYNSNPVGSKMALEVLNTMPGKKVIVTPGMIELGKEEDASNYALGGYIADVCDEVILVGKTQTNSIYDGLINKNYPKKHIYIINDVKQAFDIITKLKDKDIYVLLENDLPDIFNE